MAFVALNGYDVEHASQKAVYENLFPEIQHINGKGCIDTYTKTNDIDDVTYIDIMRVLPYAPEFRQLGSSNNGKWHNAKNEGGFNNTPQSEHYSVPVDLLYDTGVPIPSSQTYSNPVALKEVVMAQIVRVCALTINIITFGKQIQAYFLDNFTATTSTAGEVANAVFACDRTLATTEDGSYASAFIDANSNLDEGIAEIGALVVPRDERQAFITPAFDAVMKRQYMQNASEASARILANGFINPFTNTEGARINEKTGLAGQYDGVDMFIVNSITRKFVEFVVGLSKYATELELFRRIRAIIVYGGGTMRGIVGPSVTANPNVYFGGVYILPKMKVGVDCISGKSIKMVVEGGWQSTDVDKIRAKINFVPIDGVTNKAEDVIKGVFNDGKNS